MTTQTLPKDNHTGGSFFVLLVITISFISFLINGQTTINLITSEEIIPQQKISVISTIFSSPVLYWEEEIINWAIEWDIDPNLIATVMQIESCGNPNAQSGAGAIGLFQVMPFHFSENENPFDISINAKRGMMYLKKSLQEYNSPYLALAAYNGGIYGVSKPIDSWPEETKRYIYWGSNIFDDARNGLAVSPVLEEWKANGGTKLCEQAHQMQMLAKAP